MALLATTKQIAYLQDLADKADFIKMRHPSIMPLGLYHQRWELGMTSDKASRCIDFYKAILHKADMELNPWKKLAENEDLPA